jgi:hypothetical protein
MKKHGIILLLFCTLIIVSCSKDDDDDVSERFNLLTNTVWVSDELLVNGVDAGGPGQFLEDFNGEVTFNKDGTGQFGDYSGTWSFTANETQLVITSEALGFPITANIEELTSSSLKITTTVMNQAIRMTFNAK